MATRSGIPIDSYRKYEGGAAKPGADALSRFVGVGVNLNWLLAGVGEVLVQSERVSVAERPRAGYAYLPLYDVRASAGNGAVIDQEEVTDVLAFREDWLRAELNASSKDLALMFVQGESMEPDLRPGDVIMIDRRDRSARHEAIYVIRMDDAILVKELQRLRGGVIRVKSRNPRYEPFDVKLEDVQDESFAIIGRVVWGCRRL